MFPYFISILRFNPYQKIRCVNLSSFRSCLSDWSFINWLHISSLQKWFKMKQHRLLTLLAFNRNSYSVRINQQILCTLLNPHARFFRPFKHFFIASRMEVSYKMMALPFKNTNRRFSICRYQFYNTIYVFLLQLEKNFIHMYSQ